MSGFRYLVDWNGDGDDSAPECDITAYVMAARWSLGMREPSQLLADETECTLTLRNDTRRFSPEVSSSPLFGRLLPQRTLRIVHHAPVRDMAGNIVYANNGKMVLAGETFTLWRGWIVDIQPETGKHDGLTATIRAGGLKQFLETTELQIPLLENMRSDEILAELFNFVMFPPAAVGGGAWAVEVPGHGELDITAYLGDPAAMYRFDTGLATYPFFGDNFDQYTDVYRAILQLMEAELGRFFFDREGRAVFFNRDHFDAMLDPATVIPDDGQQGLQYSYGADVVNDVQITVYPRALSSTNDELLWELDKPLDIPAGETRTVRARYAQADGQQVSGRLVQAPSVSDGTLTFSEGSASITLFRAEAKNAEIELTNNSASSKCVVNMMAVKGQRVTSWNAQEVRRVNAESIGQYGRRVKRIESRLLDDTGFAETYADQQLASWALPRGVVKRMMLLNRDGFTHEQMLTRTVGDAIIVRETRTGHEGLYYIVGEQHEVLEGGTLHRTHWTLEPASLYSGWMVGVDGRGELDVNAYVVL